MNRRSFLQKLGAVVAAGVVAPQFLERAAAPAPAVVRLVDPEIGISIRFIRQFDIHKLRAQWETAEASHRALMSEARDDLRFFAGDRW